MENFNCSSHESSKHEDKKVMSSPLFYYNFLINCKYVLWIQKVYSFLSLNVKNPQEVTAGMWNLTTIILSLATCWSCSIHFASISKYHNEAGKDIQSVNPYIAAHFNYLIYISDPIELVSIIQDITTMWSNNELSFFGKFADQPGQGRPIHRIQHLKLQDHSAHMLWVQTTL